MLFCNSSDENLEFHQEHPSLWSGPLWWLIDAWLCATRILTRLQINAGKNQVKREAEGWKTAYETGFLKERGQQRDIHNSISVQETGQEGHELTSHHINILTAN